MKRKFLHITEYSSLIKHRVPERKENEFDLCLGDNIIRTTVNTNREQIKERYYNSSVIEEKTIPLDSVIIYDDMDILDEEQLIAYVYECPICKTITITTNPNYDFCNNCENTIFLPEVYALINIKQMEDIAINNSDISDYIRVKGDEIIFRDSKDDKKVKS